jgi:catechol 2,3-dioxygenase-like lactoylglutathione lyase family enzyme
MTDSATPNLPSRDFEITARFYAALGFEQSYRSDSWMILERGDLCLEFFPYPDLDPASSSFGTNLRVDAMLPLYEAARAAGIPETATGWPRLHPPRVEPWGGTVASLIDPDGTLVRLIQN